MQEAVSSLEKIGLVYLVYNLETKDILAAFTQEEDALLFRDSCLNIQYWGLGKVRGGKDEDWNSL